VTGNLKRSMTPRSATRRVDQGHRSKPSDGVEKSAHMPQIEIARSFLYLIARDGSKGLQQKAKKLARAVAVGRPDRELCLTKVGPPRL